MASAIFRSGPWVLCWFGSTGKTFTATAIMRLVDQGSVDLDVSVQTHVPEFRTKQPDVAEPVTVLQLLNHTAGWDGDSSPIRATGTTHSLATWGGWPNWSR